MKKILVAMSHKLQEKQIFTLQTERFEVVESTKFVELGCNRLAPTLSSMDLKKMAEAIIAEAKKLECTAIVMTGEPMLTFHVWRLAKEYGLLVMQSTTERKTVEIEQTDGSMLKTQVFDHVQWRTL